MDVNMRCNDNCVDCWLMKHTVAGPDWNGRTWSKGCFAWNDTNRTDYWTCREGSMGCSAFCGRTALGICE